MKTSKEHRMKTYEQILATAFRFSALGTAESFAHRCLKPMRVVLGEGLFLVVTPANASRLERMGYEMV